MMLLFACSEPTDGPGGAAKDYIRASLDRDADALHALLPTETKAVIAHLHETITATKKLIETHYKGTDKKRALAATGVSVLDKARTPARLFAVLVGMSGQPTQVEGVASLGLRIRNVDGDETSANVTTLAGDELSLEVQDGRWVVILNAEDNARLLSIRTTADGNLAKLRKAVQAVIARRYGATGAR